MLNDYSNVVILDGELYDVIPNEVKKKDIVKILNNDGYLRINKAKVSTDSRRHFYSNSKEEFVNYCKDNFYKIIGEYKGDYIYSKLESKNNEDFIPRKDIFTSVKNELTRLEIGNTFPSAASRSSIQCEFDVTDLESFEGKMEDIVKRAKDYGYTRITFGLYGPYFEGETYLLNLKDNAKLDFHVSDLEFAFEEKASVHMSMKDANPDNVLHSVLKLYNSDKQIEVKEKL